MKHNNLLILPIFALLCCSCASYHSGTIFPSTIISNSNFTILGQVEGVAYARYFFGFGGFNSQGLIAKAKNSIYKKYKLPAGTALANIILDEKINFFLIYQQKKVIITADLIDFNNPSTLNIDEIKQNLQNKKAENRFNPEIVNPTNKRHKSDNFKIGESIKFRYNFKVQNGIVKEIFISDQKLEVEYENSNGTFKKVNIGVKQIVK